MGESDNLKIVQQMEQCFVAGKLEEALTYTADDVVWIVAGSGFYPFAGRYHGRAKVKKLFQTFPTIMKVEKFETQEYVAQGDKVISLGVEKGNFIPSGRSYQVNWAHVYTLTGGKVVEFREYINV